jgi:FkbM family methyltransferase
MSEIINKNENNGVIIFGAGAVGLACHRKFNKISLPVLAFLDNYKPKDILYDGLPVFRPKLAPSSLDRSLPVIICVWRADYPSEGIKNELQEAGWTNVMTMAAFIKKNLAKYGDFYWGTTPGFYDRPDVLEKISMVRSLWADAVSQQTFEHILSLRRYFDDSNPLLPNPDEYTPIDIPNLIKSPIHYVDGGAFDGDILSKFIKLGFKIESAALFEPSPRNFQKLVERCRKNKFQFPIYSWPCALGDRESLITFHQDLQEGMASRFSDSGEIMVPIVRLDSVLSCHKPTFIKLDVEGSELMVLRGSIEIINKYLPTLAICLYHNAEDIWEIPYWLMQNTPFSKYKYYLRQHSTGLDSHCLYALPIE